MASVNPLYFNNGNLFQMTAGEIEQWRNRLVYQYSLAPTVVLTVVANSGANIDAMSDTRTQAGAASQSASAFVAEGTTAEPATVTVSYDKINMAFTTSGVGETTDTGTSFPIYFDNDTGAIRAMSLADVLDTFVHPAIAGMINATESAATAGTYTITTAASAISGYTKVSADDTAVFADTRANTGAYSAAGIPESLDQPTTVTSYYLHRRNGTVIVPDKTPLFIDGSNNLKEFDKDAAATLLGNQLRHEAANSTNGNKLSYNVGTTGAGSVRGSAMTNTKLDGDGLFATLQVNIDDYRSQEFPNGTAQNISLYNLRITTV